MGGSCIARVVFAWDGRLRKHVWGVLPVSLCDECITRKDMASTPQDINHWADKMVLYSSLDLRPSEEESRLPVSIHGSGSAKLKRVF